MEKSGIVKFEDRMEQIYKIAKMNGGTVSYRVVGDPLKDKNSNAGRGGGV